MQKLNFKLYSVEQWMDVVQTIIPLLEKPVLLLKGNLGAGKTTLTKELVKQLGSNDTVSSPTYALVNTYHAPKLKIYHFDLYRLKSKEEAYDIGIEEYLNEPNTLCVIEWPEIFEDELNFYAPHLIEIENTPEYRNVHFH